MGGNCASGYSSSLQNGMVLNLPERPLPGWLTACLPVISRKPIPHNVVWLPARALTKRSNPSYAFSTLTIMVWEGIWASCGSSTYLCKAVRFSSADTLVVL